MNPTEFESSYARAVTVFFMAMAALSAPTFIASGVNEGFSKNLLPGIALLIYLIYFLLKAALKMPALPKSDKIAFFYFPLCLVPFGCFFALASVSN
jgi:hypothetical protein